MNFACVKILIMLRYSFLYVIVSIYIKLKGKTYLKISMRQYRVFKKKWDKLEGAIMLYQIIFTWKTRVAIHAFLQKYSHILVKDRIFGYNFNNNEPILLKFSTN